MTTLYKLTDKKKQTRNNTTWGEGVTHSGTGKGHLCSEGWIHAYRHPLLATFFNPIHGNFENPLLWESEGEVALDDGMKVGCQTLTTVRQIELPKMSTVQRVACGILAVKEVYREKRWNEWAERWLSGEDRNRKSAWDMRQEMYNDAVYSVIAAYYAASAVSSSIYYAAYAASYAVSYDAYYAASSTDYSVEDVCYAVSYAVEEGVNILPLLRKAMEYK